MAGKRGGRGKPSGPLLDKLGRQFEGIMRADLKGAFATFARGVDYDAMADAVYSGDYRRVFETIDLSAFREHLERGFQSIGDALLRANEIESAALTKQLAASNPDVAEAVRVREETAQQTAPPDSASRSAAPSTSTPARPLARTRQLSAGGMGGGPPPPEDFATMELPDGGKRPDNSLLPTIDNDRVLDYVGTRTGELIQNVTEDLQTNVQNAVAVGMTNNLSPRQVAGLIRDGLPLNNRQQGALNKYQAALADTKMSKKRQVQLVERYRNALTDERATTIARTETQYAINRGMRESWDAAQRQGLIGFDSKKRWQVEAEPCEKICRPMANVRVRINDVFTLPNGVTVDTPPGHVNCRCSAVLEPDT